MHLTTQKELDKIDAAIQQASQNLNQWNSQTTTGGTLGNVTYGGGLMGGSQVYPNYVYPTPQQALPNPVEVKANFEDYIKRWLTLYNGLYTTQREKELIEKIKGLLVLDQVKNL